MSSKHIKLKQTSNITVVVAQIASVHLWHGLEFIISTILRSEGALSLRCEGARSATSTRTSSSSSFGSSLGGSSLGRGGGGRGSGGEAVEPVRRGGVNAGVGRLQALSRASARGGLGTEAAVIHSGQADLLASGGAGGDEPTEELSGGGLPACSAVHGVSTHEHEGKGDDRCGREESDTHCSMCIGHLIQ